MPEFAEDSALMGLHPGHVFTDVAHIQQLPTGSIISWGDDPDEVIALVERWHSDGSASLSHSTSAYWEDDPVKLVEPPYTLIRVGRSLEES
jgi:hypothetical protein